MKKTTKVVKVKKVKKAAGKTAGSTKKKEPKKTEQKKYDISAFTEDQEGKEEGENEMGFINKIKSVKVDKLSVE